VVPMKISAFSYIYTDSGFVKIGNLFNKKENNPSFIFPKLLSYNIENAVLEFISFERIVKYLDTDLYTSRFIDSVHGKVASTLTSIDTEIIQYNIQPTTIETIVDYNYNVYNYIANNKTLAEVRKRNLGNIVNYGNPVPNLASSDVVIRFLDKSPAIKDTAYAIEIKKQIEDPNNPGSYIDSYLNPIIFTSHDITHTYNFIAIC